MRRKTIKSALKRTAAYSLVMPALIILAQTETGNAQQTGQGRSTPEINIEAGSLSDALLQLGKKTNLSVIANSKLLHGRKVSAIQPTGSDKEILEAILEGSDLTYMRQQSGTYVIINKNSTAISSSTSSNDTDTVLLDPIIVAGDKGGFEGLLASDESSGKVTLNKKQIEMRTAGNGDINEVLKSLPNVQYQNHIGRDAGTSPVREIDLRPAEVSISGARIDDNNFILDGVEINTAGRNQVNSPTPLEDEQEANRDVIYGLHSQQVFVPDSLLEQVEVMDSDVSAEYGRFQGGVVKYTTKDANLEKLTGGIELKGTNHDLLSYILTTPNGTNPQNVKTPEFTKLNGAAHISGPVADGIGLLAMISGRYAETEDQLAPYFKEAKKVEMNTKTTTFLLKSNIEKDWGNLELQSTNTLYHQYHEFTDSLAMPITEKGNGSSNKFTFDKELDNLLGMQEVKVTVDGNYNHSEQSRTDEGDNILVHNIVSWPYLGFTNAAECNVTDPGDTVHCKKGSSGDLIQSEDHIGLKVKTEAKLFGNNLKFGAGARRIVASRERPDDVQEYNTTTIKGAFAVPLILTDQNFTCSDPNDPSCVDNEYFAARRQIYRAYDATVGLTSLDSWFEYEMDLGRLDFTLGGRVDYDSYFDNLNFAPRISSDWEMADWFDLTTSYGRYYSDSNIAYALSDARPDQINYQRDVTGGVVGNHIGAGGWVPESPATNSLAKYKGQGLKTPYNDEFSVAARIDEALLGGQLRFKFIHRKGEDQFSAIDEGSNKKMTNLGSSLYQSASVEYAKDWSDLNWGIFNTIGFSTQATWADQSSERPLSKGNDFVTPQSRGNLYNGVAYRAEDFNVVTGNMDIPLRASATIRAQMFENSLELWTTANYTFAYEGVVAARDANNNVITKDCPTLGAGKRCEVYRDKTFKPELLVNAGATYKLPKFKFGEAELNMRVENLFNMKGNAIASNSRPHKAGRRIWLGMKASF